MSTPVKEPTPGPAAAPPFSEVSRRELALYSLPEGGNALTGSMMNNLINPVLVTGLGISPGSVGVILMLRGLWDAITDPVMGFITDNTRSRWGRRRPFVFVGGILMALTMTGTWMLPADASQSFQLIYFGVAMLLFATAQTIYSVAYGALGLEMSLTYHGRTRVQMAKTLFSRIVGFLSPYMIPFCFLPMFSSPLIGVRWLSFALAIFMVAATTAAALGTRERVKLSSQKDDFLKAIGETFRSPHFQRIVFIYVMLCLVLAAFGVFGYFLGVYYVFRGDVVKGTTFMAGVETLANVLALIAIPVISRLCKTLGKHNALRIALVMMIVGSLLQIVLLDPERPYLMFVSPFFYSLGIVSVFMVLSTMMADVIDADELETHRRREGIFSATAAFMMKTVSALGAGASGFLIELTGFVVDKGADQSPGVFQNMLLLFAGKCVLLILCLLVLRNYPLTEARVVEIQEELRRRGEFPEAPPH